MVNTLYLMKERLQEIQNSITSIFDYNLNSIQSYKNSVEEIVGLIQTMPDSHNVTLEYWKGLAIEELQKELNSRFAEKFYKLSTEEQKSEFKFSKITVSNVLMNIIMNL